MERLTKTILFDGGPYHNQFMEIPKDREVVEYFEQEKPIKFDPKTAKDIAEIAHIKRYYHGTSTKYNGIQVFVHIDIKPKENESNIEDTEAG